MFSHRKGFHGKACKNRLDPGTGLVNSGAATRRRRQHEMLDAMAKPGIRWLPRSVSEVLVTGRFPNSFVGDLSARFRRTGPNGNPLLANLRKGGGVHAFLALLTDEASPVPGLADHTLLGVYRDVGAHILHLLFSVPVGPYDPYRRLFGCCGEFPP